MTNLDSILKSRDGNLPKRIRLVKAIVFPVVVYECESWAISGVMQSWKGFFVCLFVFSCHFFVLTSSSLLLLFSR